LNGHIVTLFVILVGCSSFFETHLCYKIPVGTPLAGELKHGVEHFAVFSIILK